METNQIKQLCSNQKQFFRTGETIPYAYRVKALKALKAIILKYEAEIYDALWKDLHKSKFEAYASEIGFVLEELSFHIRKLKKWMKPKRVGSGLTMFPATTYQYYEPLGNVLIIAPWNYPFQLLIAPLVGAISAGNTTILKPSEYSEHTAAIIEKMITEVFPENYIKVITGDAKVSQTLLKLKFDHIFFTGSPGIGKLVMKAAAEQMTPVTLELGGKSPCIVDQTAKLKLAATRIMWGKLLNAGQTCIAPDYLLVHESVKMKLLPALVDAVKSFYGDDEKLSPDYPRIISKPNMERLAALIDGADIYYGGTYDIEEKYFSPTILNNVSFDDAVMQQEIFGSILPVITYRTIEEVIEKVNDRPKPLALYLFSENRKTQKVVLERVPAGGVSINDTLMHIVNNKVPFGGVGNSGIGGYHGFYSFILFSNPKPYTKRGTWMDVPIRYAPYGKKLGIIKKLMK
ncbi:MAG: aldehyde dehydrogenase family protein [Bacteroidetes bacterium]|nr:MAG: aldehyde dehydrogenase family protein [Bacteroidota bacterium]